MAPDSVGPDKSKLSIKASGTAADGKRYKFNDNKTINVIADTTHANITFIETDKAIYKPGDTGRYQKH